MIDAGLLVLVLIGVLSTVGMLCIISSFFLDKPKYVPPSKHPMKQKYREEDVSFSVNIKE